MDNQLSTRNSSLAVVNAPLASQWHPVKNGALLASDVSPNSNKKAWWLGTCGHEWQATISSRNKGVGCPFCANRKVLPGFNDLATTNPALASEWNYDKNTALTPSKVTCGSDKSVWWKCPICGIEWNAKIANRNRGSGCPACSSKKISRKASSFHLKTSGSLAQTHPNLASEWQFEKNLPLTPDTVTAKSPKKVWWRATCGHEWQAIIANRGKGNGCPYCSNQKALAGFNDLKSRCPEISAEWHPTRNIPLLPSEVVYKSNKKVWWKGCCGHEWMQPISNRTVRHQGCPICARMAQTSFPEQAIFYYVKQAFPNAINSYQTIFDNEMELDIYIPEINTAIEYDGSNWHSSHNALLREEMKYQICKENGIRLIRVKEVLNIEVKNTADTVILSKRHPSAAELDTAILNVMSALNVIVDVCTSRDAAQVYAQYRQRQKGRSFQSVYPELSAEWDTEKNDGLLPEMFAPRSGISVWWKCKTCGHEWKTIIAHRAAGSGCPKCSRRRKQG